MLTGQKKGGKKITNGSVYRVAAQLKIYGHFCVKQLERRGVMVNT